MTLSAKPIKTGFAVRFNNAYGSIKVVFLKIGHFFKERGLVCPPAARGYINIITVRFVIFVCLILTLLLPQMAFSQVLRCQDVFAGSNLPKSKSLPKSSATQSQAPRSLVVDENRQFLNATLAYGNKEFPKALQLGLTLYSLNPYHYENLLLMANVYKEIGLFQLAETFYKKAAHLAFHPRIELGYLTELYEQRGQTQKLMQTLQQTVELEKAALVEEPSVDYQMHMLSMEAKLFNMQGHIEKAVQNWRQVLELNNRDAMAHSQLGRLLFLMDDPTLALYHITQAQKIKPHETLFFHQKMSALFAVKDIPAIKIAIKRMSHQAATFYQSSLHLLRGEFAEAAQLLEGQQTSLAFVRLRSQAYFSMGRLDLAQKDLVYILQRTRRTDLFTLIALYQIEKGETPLKEYEPSPLLEQIIANLSPGEWALFLRFKDKEPWIFEADTMTASPDQAIQNPFWSQLGIYTQPVNRQAVKAFFKK